MTDVIEVEYNEMDEVSKRFMAHSEEVQAVQSQLLARLADLKGGGFIGEAANAFYQEMDGEVMPAIQRLATALQNASVATQQVQATFRQAEEEGSQAFERAV